MRECVCAHMSACVCVCVYAHVCMGGAGLDFKLVPVAGQCILPNSHRHFINDLTHILHMLKECIITCFLRLRTSTGTQLPCLPYKGNSSSAGPASCRLVLPRQI